MSGMPINELTTFLIDLFLFYPICCSAVLAGVTTLLPLCNFWDEKWLKALTRAIYALFAIFVTTYVIPNFAMAPDRIIFRLDPSCSTFENPTRYICLTFSEQRERLFYITTWRKCDSLDPNVKNATKYYIVSSWIPSSDEFVTTQSLVFQPESANGKKNAYTLPEGYCVRAAGPSGSDRQRVVFTSIDLTGKRIQDYGHINSSLLKKFHSGWYLVSSCSSELSRWWYQNCTLGYVSSHYARLPQYVRKLLLEERGSI